MILFDRVTSLAHDIVAAVVGEGDVAIDATAGNGYDTAFLCRQVGATGHVYAFDVQQQAVDGTRRRLESERMLDRATVLRAGHEGMREFLPPDVRPRAIMFNLGYLPGGNRAVVTHPRTTIPAIETAADVIAPGGIVTIVLYPGHEGGAAEARHVEACAAALPQDAFQVRIVRPLNVPGNPPYLIGIRRRD